MKKKMLIVLVVLIISMLATSTVFADEYVDGIPKDSHKVKTKWNLQGTFISERDPIYVGNTWTYNVQIKEAMYSGYSTGVIEFVSGDNVITAHVEAARSNHPYWTLKNIPAIQENIAAVGWADYNGEIFNFEFMASEGWVWIILSHNDYGNWINATSIETPYGSGGRLFQLLADRHFDGIDPYDFDPYFIHEITGE